MLILRVVARFVGRMLFAPVWLVFVLICLAVLLAMMAIAFASFGFLLFAVVFGLGYWLLHDVQAGRNALQALAYGVGCFAFLVAFQGMIWDCISAVINWGSAPVPTNTLQLHPRDHDFDENPSRIDQ